MNVEKEGENYRCNVCGNEVKVTKVGGGELVCCDKPMERIQGADLLVNEMSVLGLMVVTFVALFMWFL